MLTACRRVKITRGVTQTAEIIEPYFRVLLFICRRFAEDIGYFYVSVLFSLCLKPLLAQISLRLSRQRGVEIDLGLRSLELFILNTRFKIIRHKNSAFQ